MFHLVFFDINKRTRLCINEEEKYVMVDVGSCFHAILSRIFPLPPFFSVAVCQYRLWEVNWINCGNWNDMWCVCVALMTYPTPLCTPPSAFCTSFLLPPQPSWLQGVSFPIFTLFFILSPGWLREHRLRTTSRSAGIRELRRSRYHKAWLIS